MAEALKEKLLEKIKEKKFSIAGLERAAGLKGHAVRNILLGKSKKPTAENLQAIAEALGCSVRELLDYGGLKENVDTPFTQKFKTKTLTPLKNIRLFREIIEIVLNIYQTKNYTPSVEQATSIIKEIYEFTEKNQSNKPDEKFADWLISKYIDS